MFISSAQARAIRAFLNNQGVIDNNQGSFVINEHDHSECGRVIIIFSPFMPHFAATKDGYILSAEEM